jgi:hypothetical protein
MTKQRAIKILREYINYKKKCVQIMDEDSFSTDLESVRQGLVKLAQGDKETLEIILRELESKNDSKRKK